MKGVTVPKGIHPDLLDCLAEILKEVTKQVPWLMANERGDYIREEMEKRGAGPDLDDFASWFDYECSDPIIDEEVRIIEEALPPLASPMVNDIPLTAEEIEEDLAAEEVDGVA